MNSQYVNGWTIAALAFCMGILWWNPTLGFTDDDARMILEARGVWDNGVPWGNAHLGMVLLLAPLSFAMEFMHATILLFFVACAVLAYRLHPWAGILTATSPLLLSYSCQVMTEVPFAALTLGALVLAKDGRLGWAVLVALVATTFRAIGLVLVGALVAEWALQGGWRERGAAAVAVFLGLWYVHGAGRLALLNSPYTDSPAFWGRIGNYATSDVPYAVVPLPDLAPLGALVALVGLVGLAYMRHNRVLLLYLGGYITALLLWPLGGTRYLVPLLPVLYVGVAAIRIPEVRFAAVLALLLVAGRFAVVRSQKVLPETPMGYASYFQAARALQRLPEGSVIVCRKASAMKLLSGHEALMFPFMGPDSVRSWIKDVGATHVVVDQLGYAQTARDLLPALVDGQALRPQFFPYRPIGSPPTYIFGVRRDAAR